MRMRLWLFAQVASAEEIGESEAASGEIRITTTAVGIAVEIPTTVAEAPIGAADSPAGTVAGAVLGDD